MLLQFDDTYLLHYRVMIFEKYQKYYDTITEISQNKLTESIVRMTTRFTLYYVFSVKQFLCAPRILTSSDNVILFTAHANNRATHRRYRHCCLNLDQTYGAGSKNN